MANELHVFSVTPSVKYWPVTLGLAAFVFGTGAIMFALEILTAVPAIVVMCVGLVMTIRPALKAGNTEYIVTNDRVVERSGLLTKRQREIPLAAVRRIQVGWGKFGQALDVGVLEIIGDGGSLLLEGVESPEKVRDRILALQ